MHLDQLPWWHTPPHVKYQGYFFSPSKWPDEHNIDITSNHSFICFVFNTACFQSSTHSSALQALCLGEARPEPARKQWGCAPAKVPFLPSLRGTSPVSLGPLPFHSLSLGAWATLAQEGPSPAPSEMRPPRTAQPTAGTSRGPGGLALQPRTCRRARRLSPRAPHSLLS